MHNQFHLYTFFVLFLKKACETNVTASKLYVQLKVKNYAIHVSSVFQGSCKPHQTSLRHNLGTVSP